MLIAEPSVAGPEAERRLPPWIRVRPPQGTAYPEVRGLLSELHLGTVCREARCPNLPECWSAGAATLMLLGTECTRRCDFCSVTTRWPRGVVDRSEPRRVAEAVRRWGLRYVVLTQVCRDDLDDGGADLLADTVREIRSVSPATRVELLIGDLGGSAEALRLVVEAEPDVLAHNLETTRELSGEVRDRRAGYDRSLGVLRGARELGSRSLVTKSSIMLGLGETAPSLERALGDLRAAGVDLVTLGQYLRPSARHRPVARFLPPEEFQRLAAVAEQLGFAGVASGPLVRSSYRAEELYDRARAARGG
ncbi:MAG TPA: lipoyl synthase [Thermoplasmata archaeon]|nr:lipoyl synthase [Thermoplasmata archaeon]